MILTTTNAIQGKEISQYVGIVTSNVYVNVYKSKGLSFKDSLSMIKGYENAEDGLEAAKTQALEDLKSKAKNMQGMAVVGITMDIEVLREAITMCISAMGTVVTLR